MFRACALVPTMSPRPDVFPEVAWLDMDTLKAHGLAATDIRDLSRGASMIDVARPL